MHGKVFIVHCIDTEGPLYQEDEDLFEQLEKIFDVRVEHTAENLERLRNGDLNFKNKEEIQRILDVNKNRTKGTWDEIDDMLSRITSDTYRRDLVDSNGNGWKYSWFCMDHVGFTGKNPRRRDGGYHKVFDRYIKYLKEEGDTVQFHFHPVSLSGNYNDSGTSIWGRNTINDILSHRILDRHWFPAAYRPGFHTERPDTNWFLEQWIPFDYANQSIRESYENQPDLIDGRFGDWRHAPESWIPYHPNIRDYQAKGDCHRWICRCLNMYCRTRQIEINDIRQAFTEAKNGNVILSFTDHDYKDMIFDIERLKEMIRQVSKEYPDISFEFCNAVEAMQKYLKSGKKSVELKVFVEEKNGKKVLHVTSNECIFGVQPYLAIKNTVGEYFWENFDFYDKNHWTYTFDTNTLLYEEVDSVGVAANSKTGVTDVANLKRKDDSIEYYKYNE